MKKIGKPLVTYYQFTIYKDYTNLNCHWIVWKWQFSLLLDISIIVKHSWTGEGAQGVEDNKDN